MPVKKILVVDTTRTPVSYATVQWGPGQGTSADIDGRATVNVPSLGNPVTISAIGFETINTSFNELGDVIIMQPATEQLNEVFITNKKPGPHWTVYAGIALTAIGLITRLSKDNG